MLKHEVLSFMTVEQFMRYSCLNVPIDKVTLPDGRQLDWYRDYEIHEFMKGEEIAEDTTKAGRCVSGNQPPISGSIRGTSVCGQGVGIYPDNNSGVGRGTYEGKLPLLESSFGCTGVGPATSTMAGLPDND